MLPLMKTPQSSRFVCAFVSAGLCVHVHTWAKLHEREFCMYHILPSVD